MGVMEGGRAIEIRSPYDDEPVLTHPSISGTSKKHEDSSRGADEALTRTIHEKAFSNEQNGEASFSKVSVGFANNPDEDLPREGTRTISLQPRQGRKPEVEGFTSKMDDNFDQVDGASTEPVEEASASGLANDSTSVFAINNNIESPTGSKGVASPIGDDDKLAYEADADLRSKPDEETTKPTDDKPVDFKDEHLVSPTAEKPASPVPLSSPRFRGKPKFEYVPGLSSSSNRPTL